MLPSISLPKGGGAMHGIGEKFTANPVTGTGALSVPLPLSPGRSGFTPALSLSYDSGSGNGPYGFGWNVGYPSITRRTDRGLPRYLDHQESDVYILAGAEDLVPVLRQDGSRFEAERDGYSIQRYRPRIEGLFARIERWSSLTEPSDVYWRTISRDNVSTFYGKTVASRIADPADPSRIFSWLLCESFDDKGNAALYEYAEEDGNNVDLRLASEYQRDASSRRANRYLKRVKYGNATSRLMQADLSQAAWLFELVMDYGDHPEESPSVEPTRSWRVRPDPFSTYRAGFEVRTYRRCQRVLMFHRFTELGPEPKLVRALGLDYDDFAYSQGFDTQSELAHAGSTRLGSFLRRVKVTGYADSGVARSMPPLEFSYSRSRISPEVRSLDEASGAHLPMGVDGARYQWLDLEGEGISGVFTEQGNAWWYTPNLGDGRLGAQRLVAQKPSFELGSAQFLDLAGDGQLDVVELRRPNAGFFERDDHGGWSPFEPFAQQPNLDWDSPQLRFIDLTGDGHADVLLTEDDVLCWHPSLGEAGFGPRESVPMAFDEASGPKLVFHDTTDTIFLADMTGDGLTDLVRIRNAEICYWPNLGYGRFGAKVTMDDAPVLDAPDLFEPRRIRLADIDGSGTIDLIYLGSDGVRLYFNRAGNGWSKVHALQAFPAVDNLSQVNVIDLLGNGTACLVWSTPLPNGGAAVRFVDLMGSQKPHLLVEVENNLGARTSLRYSTSTRFYLEDERAGRPWITRLPFPVHVVERVETYDAISRNRFVTRYTYHHGYFDGVEREFRGFGMVEQFDTEEFAALDAGQELSAATNLDPSSHVPPVLTRTWFHTGIHFGLDRVSKYFAGLLEGRDTGEYYREPGLTSAEALELLLEDTVLPAGLSVEEEREASRALKGAMLRQEIYALDGTDKQPHPYSVTEQNFTLRRLQPKGANLHAVFLAHPRESLAHQYERTPSDPRVAHALTLEVDDFGNVLKSAAVAYGRRRADPRLEARDQQKQAELHVSYAENEVTNSVEAAEEYRAPLPWQSRSYELTGLALLVGRQRFTLDEVLAAGLGAATIEYEQSPVPGLLQKRVIEYSRTLFRSNDLVAALPLGHLESFALPFEAYQLAFTPGLFTAIYATKADVAVLAADGGYVQLEGADGWWIPSGRVFHSRDPNDDAASELANARQHFFLPRRYEDPFGHATRVDFDAYDLLVIESSDALGNRLTVGERDTLGDRPGSGYDYRVLQPRLITDINGNRAAASFDALGMVVGTAVMGKWDETPHRGDSLDDFVVDLAEEVVTGHLADPLTHLAASPPDGVPAAPHTVLARATTRLIYDWFAYYRTKHEPQPSPNVVYSLVRETHDADLALGERTKIQHAFSYSDGFGREIQKKVQAEPGPVPRRDATTGRIIIVDGQPELTEQSVNPRWVGSGWVVLNNKGKPVRQFEPFFTDTHRFEFDVRIGVSPVLFYDPTGRVVATLHPDHTWDKVVFDAWRQESWDGNDTVLISDPRLDADVGAFFQRIAPDRYLPSWHAQRQAGELGPEEQAATVKAAVHAGTPAVAHADSLGRTFLTVAHNRFQYSSPPPAAPPTEEFHVTRVAFDIEGNQREVIDAKDRVVMRYDYDQLGHRIHQASMEAGERWALPDVMGKPIYAWDTRGHQFRTRYDELRRPTETFLRASAQGELLLERTVYGEGHPDREARNLRGKPVALHDQAGVVTTDDYDFRGNLLRSRRQLAREYKATLDWSGAVPLEADEYTTSTRFDALNRPIEQVTPDASVIRHTFNEANLLESVAVNLRGADAATPFVGSIDYDAKGRRTRTRYGNGVETRYEYDPLTLRLSHLVTKRPSDLFPGDCPEPPNADWPGSKVQNLRYTYDPVGNITRIRDHAQQAVYFANHRVEPSNDYIYDSVYRLIEATGREHLGMTGGQPNRPRPADAFDTARVRLAHPNDGAVMGTYRERYTYDAVGNFLALQHSGSSPAHSGWTRNYAYSEASQLEPGKQSNRLSTTTIGGLVETYLYEGSAGLHGSITRMPHLPVMRWDYRDQLQATSRQVVNDGTPETTWYVYDAAGQRVRKVTERQSSDPQGVRAKERIYLGGLEIYREYGGDGASTTLERETLHVMDDRQRIGLVETRTQGNEGSEAGRLIRYQLGNHLGSVSLELDDQSQVISYEEYTPYGSTSCQAVRSDTEAAKRYRYTGMERDEESGLSYHGARHYAQWIGRWTAVDPSGLVEGPNLYIYVASDPIAKLDQLGLEGVQPEDQPTEGDVRSEENGDEYVWSGERWNGPAIQVEGEPPSPHGPDKQGDQDWEDRIAAALRGDHSDSNDSSERWFRSGTVKGNVDSVRTASERVSYHLRVVAGADQILAEYKSGKISAEVSGNQVIALRRSLMAETRARLPGPEPALTLNKIAEVRNMEKPAHDPLGYRDLEHLRIMKPTATPEGIIGSAGRPSLATTGLSVISGILGVWMYARLVIDIKNYLDPPTEFFLVDGKDVDLSDVSVGYQERHVFVEKSSLGDVFCTASVMRLWDGPKMLVLSSCYPFI